MEGNRRRRDGGKGGEVGRKQMRKGGKRREQGGNMSVRNRGGEIEEGGQCRKKRCSEGRDEAKRKPGMEGVET